jgi:hypothetical protein
MYTAIRVNIDVIADIEHRTSNDMPGVERACREAVNLERNPATVRERNNMLPCCKACFAGRNILEYTRTVERVRMMGTLDGVGRRAKKAQKAERPVKMRFGWPRPLSKTTVRRVVMFTPWSWQIVVGITVLHILSRTGAQFAAQGFLEGCM